MANSETWTDRKCIARTLRRLAVAMENAVDNENEALWHRWLKDVRAVSCPSDLLEKER